MKTSRNLIALTAINFVLLLLAVAQQLHPAFAQIEPSVLRGRALEIVDGQGRVRASINVLPPGKSSNGEETHETVLLRLNTERGRPSVKIGSSEPVSGLSFAGPTGTKDTYVILQAKGTATSPWYVGREDDAAYTFDPQQLPGAGQLPTGIDRALRLLIPLPVLIRNDQGESDGQA